MMDIFCECFRKAIRLVVRRTPKKDGLNTIEPLYDIIHTEQRALFTWILCDVYEGKGITFYSKI